jgi:hypothetical protein
MQDTKLIVKGTDEEDIMEWISTYLNEFMSCKFPDFWK